MEPAIDPRLQCPRTRPNRLADGYMPPFPTFTTRLPASMTEAVIGYFGVQSREDVHNARLADAFRTLKGLFAAPHGPKHTDYVQYIDGQGYKTLLSISYWPSFAEYALWQEEPPVFSWWNAGQRMEDGIGYFREIMCPRVEQFETAYGSAQHIEGLGVIMGQISGEIQEHGYWGSMRDRIPLSQTDSLSPTGHLAVEDSKPSLGNRVFVLGHQNLAMIRSGQDWVDATAEERRIYLEDIEPVLRDGMDFLRDRGTEIGCYNNRYVRVTDTEGRFVDKSFGVSYWHSLADLERWAESHPTHLKIFKAFLSLVPQLPNVKLYHEVAVFNAEDQIYEYINCHPQTGLLQGVTCEVAG